MNHTLEVSFSIDSIEEALMITLNLTPVFETTEVQGGASFDM